jgi:hypothetical protein
MRRPPDLPTLRAAWWTLRALHQARRGLAQPALALPALSEPPSLPASAERGVGAVLRRRPASCLERALVLQRWEASQGYPRDVVIGVTSPDDFAAHAWLDGDPDEAGEFAELLRLPAE